MRVYKLEYTGIIKPMAKPKFLLFQPLYNLKTETILKTFFTTLLIVLFIKIDIFSQDFRKLRFENLTIEDGLSENSILSINQDQFGFLWVGTYAGLNRYDGNEFEVFQKSKERPDLPFFSNIFNLSTQGKDRIWVTNYNQLYRFDQANESFIQFDYSSESTDTLTHTVIRGFIEDSDSNLWIGTFGNGLYFVDLKTMQKKHYFDPSEDSISSYSAIISSVFEDRNGQVWLATENGLLQYDKINDGFISYVHDPEDPHSISSNKVISICDDSFGNLWVGTWEAGLNRLDLKTRKFERFLHDSNDPHSLSGNIVRCLFEDSQKNLWIGTQINGLCLYDRNQNKFFNYRYEFCNQSSIGSNTILTIFEDNTGIIWIGTEFGGLSKLNLDKNKFQHYQFNPSKKNSLNNNIVKSIFVKEKEGSEIIWVGTNGGGINLINTQTHQVEYLMHDEKNPNTLSGNVVTSITECSDGLIWIGTENGLDSFDPKTNKIQHYLPPFEPVLQNTDISDIMEDSDQLIWIGYFNGGIVVYDKKNGQYTHFHTNDGKSINDNIIRQFCEDKNQRIWIGTDFGGLNCYDKKTKKFYNFKMTQKFANHPVSIKVTTVFLDSDNYLWMRTNSGLTSLNLNHFKLDYFSDSLDHHFQIKSYSTLDGLCNDVVYAIAEDSHKQLWMSTPRGLSCFNKKMETFKNYFKSDGLQSDQFYTNSFFQNKEGTIYLGGINGLSVFHPDSIQPNPVPPGLAFTQFLLFGKTVNIGDTINDHVILSKNLNYTDEIELHYRENSFAIEFAALHFNTPKKNHYSYQMKGFNKQWQENQRRFATYTNLPEGKYQFLLKAANGDGVWNENCISINLRVIPPFWKTFWFRFLLSSCLIGTIVAFFIFRIRNINHQKLELEEKVKKRTNQLQKKTDELQNKSEQLAYANLKLEEMDQLKNDFIANVTHDFRSPLMVIINASDLALKYGSNIRQEIRRKFELIFNSGTKLRATIDRLLEISRMDSKGIQLKIQKTDIKSLLAYLTDFYSSSVSTTSNIKIIPQFPIHQIENFYTDQEKLEEVINNLISNAIKYVDLNQGEIKVLLLDQEDKIIIKIIDNGQGIPKEKLKSIFNRFEQVETGMNSIYKGTGIGLAFAKQLVGYLKGDIYADSEGLGKGAIFTIELRKGYDFYKPGDLVEAQKGFEELKNSSSIRHLIAMELQEKIKTSGHFVQFDELNADEEYEYKKGKILIIDDNKNIQSIILEYLKNNGFKNFIVVSDGNEGLKAAYEYLPDIIICDYNMPGMKGDELHNKLYKNPNFKHVPFIFVSAIADKDIIIERKKKGAIAYLAKPIDEKELILTVEMNLKKQMEFKAASLTSVMDELTMLYNKQSIEKLLIDNLSFREGQDLSVFFIDMDHFDQYNSHYSNKEGDFLLMKIARTIKNSIRKNDKAGRYDSKKFLVVLPDTSENIALEIAEKIHSQISDISIPHDDSKTDMKSSIGLASLKKNESVICNQLNISELTDIFDLPQERLLDWDDITTYKNNIKKQLLSLADQALVQAKSTLCKNCGFASDKEFLFSDKKCPECNSDQLIWGRNKIRIYQYQ